MSDEEARHLERKDWCNPRALAAAARAGRPHACVFCGHTLDGRPTCGHREPWQVGDFVREPGGHVVGRLVQTAPPRLAVNTFGANHDRFVDSVRTYGVVELPAAWQQPPCACSHEDVPAERELRDYEEACGVDLRVLRMLQATYRRGEQRLEDVGLHGFVFYHVVWRNADGTPWRMRATGNLKTWKTRPGHFRLPVARGMPGSRGGHADYLTHDNARDFRTQEEWAYSYGELLQQRMSRRALENAKEDYQRNHGRTGPVLPQEAMR